MRAIAFGVIGVLALGATGAFAATKTYQVTGPVVSVDDTSITVQKGKENWEIARDASTKVTGDLKVGSKVTVEYRMTATTATVKEAAKGAAKPADTKAADTKAATEPAKPAHK